MIVWLHWQKHSPSLGNTNKFLALKVRGIAFITFLSSSLVSISLHCPGLERREGSGPVRGNSNEQEIVFSVSLQPLFSSSFQSPLVFFFVSLFPSRRHVILCIYDNNPKCPRFVCENPYDHTSSYRTPSSRVRVPCTASPLNARQESFEFIGA